MSFRTGFAALFGRPNAGKSTLLNQILAAKLAITSSKPQTTRDRIAGVHTTEDYQLVLLDTPGVHDAWTELNKAMVTRALDTLAEADVVLWLVDTATVGGRIERDEHPLDAFELSIADRLAGLDRPVILVVNKIDVVPEPLADQVVAAYREAAAIGEVVRISALTGDGVADLLRAVVPHLPAGPPVYPPEHWTEATERFLAAEIVREKCFHLLDKELPYATFVEIEQFDESERDTRGLVRVMAAVVVERSSQKGIVIGKGGEMIKRIGTLARKDLARLLDCKVHLELFVKVEKDWTKSKKGLRRVGFE